MRAKILICALPAIILVISHLAEAQQLGKPPRLGYISGGSSHTGTNPAAFWQGLRELNYVEGKNILFEYGLAERKLDRLPVVAAQLVGLKPREGCDSARSCFIVSPAIGDLSPEKLLEDCGRIHLIHSGASICDADC